MRASTAAAGRGRRGYNTTQFPRPSRQQIVERAEAFLSAHIDESVSIARLCREVGVSERGLRNAFYEIRGMSPKRCALRTRLGGVHRALRCAEAAHSTVTDIATGYGFFELGRFAGTYKAVFGETPSATLRAADERALAS